MAVPLARGDPEMTLSCIRAEKELPACFQWLLPRPQKDPLSHALQTRQFRARIPSAHLYTHSDLNVSASCVSSVFPELQSGSAQTSSSQLPLVFHAAQPRSPLPNQKVASWCHRFTSLAACCANSPLKEQLFPSDHSPIFLSQRPNNPDH